MEGDVLKAALRLWGRYYGERRSDYDDDGLLIGDTALAPPHPIARAMEFAGGGNVAVGRSGARLRRLAGQRAWATDPMPSTETRSHRMSQPDDIPKLARTVEAAALDLQFREYLPGRVLRVQYCRLGDQVFKAGIVEIPLRRYLDELRYAKAWISGRLSYMNEKPAILRSGT